MAALLASYLDVPTDPVTAPAAHVDPAVAESLAILADQGVFDAEITGVGRSRARAEISYRRRAQWHVLCYEGQRLARMVTTPFSVQGIFELALEHGLWSVLTHKLALPSELLSDGPFIYGGNSSERLRLTAHPERYRL